MFIGIELSVVAGGGAAGLAGRSAAVLDLAFTAPARPELQTLDLAPLADSYRAGPPRSSGVYRARPALLEALRWLDLGFASSPPTYSVSWTLR